MTENKNNDTFSLQSFSDNLRGNSYTCIKFSALWLLQFHIQCLSKVIQGVAITDSQYLPYLKNQMEIIVFKWW